MNDVEVVGITWPWKEDERGPQFICPECKKEYYFGHCAMCFDCRVETVPKNQ